MCQVRGCCEPLSFTDPAKNMFSINLHLHSFQFKRLHPNNQHRFQSWTGSATSFIATILRFNRLLCARRSRIENRRSKLSATCLFVSSAMHPNIWFVEKPHNLFADATTTNNLSLFFSPFPTDVALKFVPSFCTGLRELSVSDCANITDFGLYELAKLGATLRYLSVAKCDRVSDAGLKVIARRCYKLRYLNARGCEAVSDDSITVLARSCPRLRALDIGKCDVSDTGLHALAESCPNLKKISLRNCDMITDRGVQCIAYYCRGLQHLNIQDCQITLEGYRAVKKYCKRCIIEHTNPGFC